MRVAIVGYGRAGRIQKCACAGIVEVATIVDERASLANSLDDAATTWETSMENMLVDPTIDAVLVTTPTPTHYDVCKAALEAKKHVFVEKPLAENGRQVEELYLLAKETGCLLFTAYNRRHDPEWTRIGRGVAQRQPFHISVVCRDHPFPPAAYLETCGGILRDAGIHDLDMLCHMLQDTPTEVRCHIDERKETTSTHLLFSRGCRAHLLHSRHSICAYDQRVQVFYEDGMDEMGRDTPNPGTSFSDRYRDSYVAQMRDFVSRIETNNVAPNIPLEHAKFLERLVEACERASRTDEVVSLKTLRAYEAAQTRVRQLYYEARVWHTVERSRALIDTYRPNQFGTMGVWDTLDALEKFVDLSDPDVDVPNVQHALQTAESLRRSGMPEWLQFVGLIHDMGKILYLHGSDADGTSLSTQFSLVGDTYVLGCALPSELVYPEFNTHAPEQYERTGIYEPHCGLDKCTMTFGHDEYLYRVLQASDHTLPDMALGIIRYHSLYVWHDRDAYSELECPEDRLLKGWVKLFNQHDLYSKSHRPISMDLVRPYYQTLVDKFLPKGFAF